MLQMIPYRDQLVAVLRNLCKAREIVFIEIVDFDKTNESNEIKDVFNLAEAKNDYYTLDLEEITDVRDINLSKLIDLCLSMQENIERMMSDNDIDEDEVFNDDE